MTLSPIRKIYQGVADRRQMFRMFDRHAQRPNRAQGAGVMKFAIPMTMPGAMRDHRATL